MSKFYVCPDCGRRWVNAIDGPHDCKPFLKARIEELNIILESAIEAFMLHDGLPQQEVEALIAKALVARRDGASVIRRRDTLAALAKLLEALD